MFHKINLPDCAPQLMRLTEIAVHVVTFGLTHDRSILNDYDWDGSQQGGLARTLGDDFLRVQGGHRLLAAVKHYFLRHFESINRLDVGETLWKSYAKIGAPVVKIVVVPLDQKSDILEAFKHDADIESVIQAPGPRIFQYIALPEQNDVVKETVKELMVNFYDDILVKKGISAEMIGDVEDLNHQSILQSYHRVNINLKVCPGCDGEPPRIRTVSDAPGKVLLSANIDHFLPKMKYPFLAVHPWNLVPMCSPCNQERKRANDALQAPGVIDLDDIYHPYLRGAYGEVEVIVERDEHDHRPHIRIRPRNEERCLVARLNSLDHVMGLQSYWDGELQNEAFDGKIMFALSSITQDERDKNERHLDEWLCSKLQTIGQRLDHVIGKEPRTVATQAYAKWLATDGDAQTERVRLLNTALGIEPGAVNPTQARFHPGPVA